MPVAVEVTRRAKKGLDSLPAIVKARVAAVLAILTDYPRVPNDRKDAY